MIKKRKKRITIMDSARIEGEVARTVFWSLSSKKRISDGHH